jgi:hypothetical protein
MPKYLPPKKCYVDLPKYIKCIHPSGIRLYTPSEITSPSITDSHTSFDLILESDLDPFMSDLDLPPAYQSQTIEINTQEEKPQVEHNFDFYPAIQKDGSIIYVEL